MTFQQWYADGFENEGLPHLVLGTRQRMYDYAPRRWVQVELQKDSDRVHRFIEAFEKLYGREPKPEDAEGNFVTRVAQDMRMSVGGARYYIRRATERTTER